jgi:hypothetical protein
VQLALAREFGLDGWTTLKQMFVDRTTAARSLDEAVSLFLDNACPDHHVRGGSDHVRAKHTAMRLLARYPEIATANFYTAVVCGSRAESRPRADPGWATRRNGEPGAGRTGAGGEGDLTKRDWGSKGWEPPFTCALPGCRYLRSPERRRDRTRPPDRGANPNVYFFAGGSA